MEPLEICFEGLDIQVSQRENMDYELFFERELVAVITPRARGGWLSWHSPHIEHAQAQLIGSLIASRLIRDSPP